MLGRAAGWVALDAHELPSRDIRAMAPETSASATNDELQIQQAEIHAGPFAHVSDDESDSDSDCAPPQTLAQELAERLKHVEDGSGRGPEERESSLEQATPLEGEFYSEAGMQARMELLEKESIKQALEDLWTAANCVDPTDGIIDKQELTLRLNPGP